MVLESGWKRTPSYYPILCFLDNTNEALAGILRTSRRGECKNNGSYKIFVSRDR
jgi:hypothetical protein